MSFYIYEVFKIDDITAEFKQSLILFYIAIFYLYDFTIFYPEYLDLFLKVYKC